LINIYLLLALKELSLCFFSVEDVGVGTSSFRGGRTEIYL
jgi:hypothetical protein